MKQISKLCILVYVMVALAHGSPTTSLFCGPWPLPCETECKTCYGQESYRGKDGQLKLPNGPDDSDENDDKCRQKCKEECKEEPAVSFCIFRCILTEEIKCSKYPPKHLSQDGDKFKQVRAGRGKDGQHGEKLKLPNGPEPYDSDDNDEVCIPKCREACKAEGLADVAQAVNFCIVSCVLTETEEAICIDPTKHHSQDGDKSKQAAGAGHQPFQLGAKRDEDMAECLKKCKAKCGHLGGAEVGFCLPLCMNDKPLKCFADETCTFPPPNNES